jgi:hypothetical protein
MASTPAWAPLRYQVVTTTKWLHTTIRRRRSAATYWVFATWATVVVSFLVSEVGFQTGLVYDAPKRYCEYHFSQSAHQLAHIGMVLALVGGVSALFGVALASGRRWWFVVPLLASPLAVVQAFFATGVLYTPNGCPGPFS